MIAYEVLLMLDAGVAEPRQTEIVARVRSLVEKGGGTWQQHVPWGKRRLAYEIAHKDEGIYHLLTFEAAPDTVEEIGRVLRIDDDVMRHMAVRRIEGSSTAAPALLTPEPSAAPEPPPSAAAPVAAVAAPVVAEPEAEAEAAPVAVAEVEAEAEPAAETQTEPATESVQAAE
ncbi:MAG: small subunit ribosomal protein [Gaiellaceae bacterium]|nr:small subunit ribosomal protein [Gaiellaceae bacterium]